MDQIVDQIRAALVPGASPDTRAAGAIACRAVLAALDERASEAPSRAAPDAPTSAPAPAPPSSAPSAAVALLAQLGRIPSERRVDIALDLAIAKLGAMLPADAPPIEVRSPRFMLAPLGAHVPPRKACASCGESGGHGWWCERGRAA